MPGQLKNDAVCPHCGDDLICIIDESNTEYVRRDYIHAKGSPKARWRRRCVRIFTDHDEAARERKALEVVADWPGDHLGEPAGPAVRSASRGACETTGGR